VSAVRVVLHGTAVSENEARLRRHARYPVEVTHLPDAVGLQEFRKAMAHADVLVATELKHDLRDFAGLRLLQVHAAGYERIDFDCLPSSTPVCRATGHGPGIAEYVLMAALAANHKLVVVDQSLRKGRWQFRGAYHRPHRRELSSSSVGILGFGEIGVAVAELIRPLCAEVTALVRTPASHRYVDEWFAPEQLHEFLARCDYLVICLPLTDATRGLIGAAELRALQPGATVINIARGAVVDQHALFDALKNGSIGGAVLDVWWNYPGSATDVVRASDLPFESLANVILTPHISGWTEDILERRWKVIASNIAAAVHGEGTLSQLVRAGTPMRSAANSIQGDMQ